MNALIIARFTLQEAISRRLVLAGVVLSLAFVALFAIGFTLLYHHRAALGGSEALSDTQIRAGVGTVLTVLGLYAVYFLSGFLALFLSVGAVSGEIDAGTLHALLARPLRRAEFIAGRWLAYTGLISVYVAVMAGSLLLCVRVIGGYGVPDPLRAVGLLVLATVVLLSLSLFGSTLFSTLANGVVVFTLFGMTWMAGIIEFVGAGINNEAMLNVGTAAGLLLPSDAVWRGASYYVQSPLFLAALDADSNVGIPFASIHPPSTPLVLWGLLYPLLFLGGAVLTFRRRDL